MSELLQVSCPSCHIINRIPIEKSGVYARCGQCHEPLPVVGPDYPVPISEHAFRAEVMRSALPVLVDFWAEWCAPCRQLSPLLTQVARDYSGRLKVVKINVDENSALAKQFQIRSVPTMILFASGRVKDQFTGALPAQKLRHWIDRSMGWS